MSDWKLRKRRTARLAQEGLSLLEELPASRARSYIAGLLFPRAQGVERRTQPGGRLHEGFQELVPKIDQAFSEYIRIFYADDHGICECITCKRPHHYKDIDCGHFCDRARLPTRWETKNARPQCRDCNRIKRGRKKDFAKVLDKLHGPGTARMLEEMSKKPGYDIRVKAAGLFLFWKKALLELKRERGFK